MTRVIKPKTIKTKATTELGRLYLLPSEIDTQAAIRYKEQKDWDGPSIRLSFISNLLPKTRSLTLYPTWRGEVVDVDIKDKELTINTPRITYQFDMACSIGKEIIEQFNLGNKSIRDPQVFNNAYFYLTSERNTLKDALLEPKHYFFPHVYFDGHLCMGTRYGSCESPRSFNRRFWENYFSAYWLTGYDKERLKERRNLEKAHKADYKSYQAYQDNSSNAILDEEHREFLASYTDYYETVDKPSGIFVSHHPKFIEDKKMPKIEGQLFVAFAYLDDNQNCWIKLENNQIFKLSKEQVKVQP